MGQNFSAGRATVRGGRFLVKKTLSRGLRSDPKPQDMSTFFEKIQGSSESIPPISIISAETCHTLVGTCVHSQMKDRGFESCLWRFFWRFWRFSSVFFSALQVQMTCIGHNHKQQKKSCMGNLGCTFPVMSISCNMSCDDVVPRVVQSLSTGPASQNSHNPYFPYFATRSFTVMVFNVFGFFALCKGFTGFTGTARVAVVVAVLVAVAVAVVAAVVVLVEIADRLDVDPKKGFGRAWRTHSSQITQSSAQSECFCRRVQRSNSAKDKKATVSAFLEWHTLQGIVWSKT